MVNAVSQGHDQTLDRLLTALANRLGGAVDFWTAVCLLPPDAPLDRRAFVVKNLEELRRLLDEVRSALRDAGHAEEEPVRRLLRGMTEGLARLLQAFLVLVQFRTVTLEELRGATETLTEVHGSVLQAIQDLARVTGIRVSFFDNWTEERARYFQGILGRLFQLACEARGAVPPATPASLPHDS